MKWDKLGRIFHINGNSDLMYTHSQAPTPFRMGEKIRIYFSTRDKAGQCRPAYIDVLAKDPARVLAAAERPLIDLGKPGAFDDCGVMPTCIIQHKGLYLMYYIGWSRCVKTPYQQNIGLLVSEDGESFRRISDGPLIGKSFHDPFGAASPCVLQNKMAYISYTDWVEHDGLMEPTYQIKVIQSDDPYSWQTSSEVAIGGECLARPWFVAENKMTYSLRESTDFRANPKRSYRTWEAFYYDGCWNCFPMAFEPSPEGWDSEMIAYGVQLRTEYGDYFFYNGNGFGRAGMGAAILR